jgi:hypothetical protein
MNKLNYIGRRVGKLTVIKEDTARKVSFWDTRLNKKREVPCYVCRCDCGNVISVRRYRLGFSPESQTKSCGCLQKEWAGKMGRKFKYPQGVKPLNDIYNNYRTRSKKRGYLFLLTKEEFSKIVSQCCYYCGNPPTKQVRKDWGVRNDFLIFNGIDRIDSTNGYTSDNVVACCSDCNYAKAELSQSDFFKLIGRIYNKHKTRIENE